MDAYNFFVGGPKFVNFPQCKMACGCSSAILIFDISLYSKDIHCQTLSCQKSIIWFLHAFCPTRVLGKFLGCLLPKNLYPHYQLSCLSSGMSCGKVYWGYSTPNSLLHFKPSFGTFVKNCWGDPLPMPGV